MYFLHAKYVSVLHIGVSASVPQKPVLANPASPLISTSLSDQGYTEMCVQNKAEGGPEGGRGISVI